MRKIENSELKRLNVEEFKRQPKNPMVLVLDDIRSMHNVGSAFRTADAFLLEKIYLCGITAQPPHREINKTALGATESVAWEYSPEVVPLAKQLVAENYRLLIVEQTDSSTMLSDFQPDPQGKYALVFGNEVFGVKDELLPLADSHLEIPQFGTKHSLNISVSLGIVVWSMMEKMQLLQTP